MKHNHSVSAMETERWLVGPEHDQSLRDQLRSALIRSGFSISSTSCGVSGSQEVARWQATKPEGSLSVEAETYIGLIVEGPVRLVQQAKAEFERCIKR